MLYWYNIWSTVEKSLYQANRLSCTSPSTNVILCCTPVQEHWTFAVTTAVYLAKKQALIGSMANDLPFASVSVSAGSGPDHGLLPRGRSDFYPQVSQHGRRSGDGGWETEEASSVVQVG